MSKQHTLTATGPAIPQFLGHPALEPVRLVGREGIDTLFEYQLVLKTPDSLNLGASGAADFNLDHFIGREVSCTNQRVAALLLRYADAVGLADKAGVFIGKMKAISESDRLAKAMWPVHIATLLSVKTMKTVQGLPVSSAEAAIVRLNETLQKLANVKAEVAS